jgi:hypothetical protein
MIFQTNIRLNIISFQQCLLCEINVNDFNFEAITENDDLNFHGFHARAWQLLLTAMMMLRQNYFPSVSNFSASP